MTPNFNNIDNMIAGLVEGNGKLKFVPKRTLKDYVVFIEAATKINHDVLYSLSEQSRKKLAARISSTKDHNGVSDLYKSFVKGLERNAASKEKTAAFESIMSAAAATEAIVAELSKNIDALFANKVISIYNTKVSHAMALGMLHDAKTFARWSSYLFTGISSNLANLQIAKYRINFLESNLSQMVNYVNDLNNKTGVYNILTSIKQIRTNNKDAKIVSDSNSPNTAVVLGDGSMRQQELDMFKKGLHSLNPFRLIGEAWNLFKHWLNDWNVSDKQWMEAHVALLRLELEGVSPDSEEYIRLQKIIDVYDEKIIKLDKKINEYYES